MPRRLLLLLGLALVLPANAWAGDAHDRLARRPACRPASPRRGRSACPLQPGRPALARAGRVQFRTRSLAGRWGDVGRRRAGGGGPAEHGRDRADAARAPGGSAVPGGSGLRTGSSTGCVAASRGCGRSSSGARRTACPAAPCRRPVRRRSCRAAAGGPTSRSGGRARSTPRRSQMAIVHHTAGSNGYSQAEAPAIVRGIEIYHVKGNGWNDIGYNFLVDRFGQVYEGRFGGIERNVIGAHAQGFNTGSVGVSVIGEYSSLAISSKARDALERLLAWRLDIAHVDPATTLTYISGGNPALPRGRPGLSPRRSRGTATPASPTVPGTGSTASSTRSPATSRGSGCRSSTRRPSPGRCPASSGSARASRRRCPGRSTCWTPREASSPRRAASARRSTGRGTPRSPRPARTRMRSAAATHLTPAVGTIGSGELAARDLRTRRRSRDRHTERRRRRGCGHDLVLAERAGCRHRDRPRRPRRRRRDAAAGLEARGDAEAPFRPGCVAGRDLRRRALGRGDRRPHGYGVGAARRHADLGHA